MKIERMTVGMLEEHAYFIIDEATRKTVIVDPGADEAKIINKIEKEGLEVDKILLTHGHADHIGAVAAIREHTGCEVVIHEEGKRYLEDPNYNLSVWIGMDPIKIQGDRYVKDKEVIQVEGTDIEFEVVHAPGHTMDGVAYFNKKNKVAFVGDIIFKGSMGRTDFPGGNANQLLHSITSAIFSMGKEITLYPGHGEPTTVEFEMLNNPYINMFD